jgi:ATPase subunit of ABC transporter with duplicated ATPase domains
LEAIAKATPRLAAMAVPLAPIASLKGMRGRAAPGFDVEGLAGIKLGALSLGQRQRVSLAAAWLGEPDLLLLDEPTNAFDADTREALASALVGRTAVIATHDRASPRASRRACSPCGTAPSQTEGSRRFTSRLGPVS